MTAFVNHFLYDFRIGLRDKSLMLLNYLFPLGFYALMGLLMTGLNPTFAPTMIPTMILVAVMACTMLGLPYPVVESRESGIFRSFKINGIPALSIVTIPILSSFVHVMIVSIIIAVTAIPFFGAGTPTDWGMFVLILILTIFTFASLGVLIGVVSPNSRMIVLFSQLVFLPSMIIGGLMIPSNMLPPALYRISLLLPTVYSINAWRGLAFNMEIPFDPIWSLIILLSSAIISYVLSIYLFSWDSKNKRKDRNPVLGLITLVPYVLGAIFLAG
jgi:ABC-2 type transport system permease protein